MKRRDFLTDLQAKGKIILKYASDKLMSHNTWSAHATWQTFTQRVR